MVKKGYVIFKIVMFFPLHYNIEDIIFKTIGNLYEKCLFAYLIIY